MIKIEDPELNIVKSSYCSESNCLHLEDNRYKHGYTDYKKQILDLNQLVSIQLIYENVDVNARKVQALKEAQKLQNKKKEDQFFNTALGVVAGSVVDSFIGDDDSLLDGAILGGLAGYALSDTSPVINTVNLTENTEHYVVLLFRNGNSVTAVINAKGMADLIGAVHKTRSVPADKEIKSPWLYEELNSHEMEIARNYRIDKIKNDKHEVSNLLIALKVLLLAVVGLYLVGSQLVSSWYGEYSITPVYYLSSLIFIVFLYLLKRRKQENLLIEKAIQELDSNVPVQ